MSHHSSTYFLEQSPTRLQTAFLLGLTIIVAAFFRFWDISTESLWVDEIYSFRQALKSTALIIANASSDVHPPVYYIFLHFWTLLFGTTELGLRSFSAFTGILAVPCIYVLGRDLFSADANSRRIGLYAAFLLALSHFHIHYSQEARNYSYVVLVVIVGMIGFVRYLRHFDAEVGFSSSIFAPPQTLVLYFVSTLFVLYSHFFALFIIAAENVLVFGFVLFRRDAFRRMWKSWVALQASLLLAFAPWLNILYWQIKTVTSSFWIERPNYGTLLETVVEFCGSLSAAVFIVPLAMLAFVVFRHDSEAELSPPEPLSKRSPKRLPKLYIAVFWRDYRAAMLLLCFVLPILIPYFLSLYSRPIYYVKYTIPALPAFLLLAAKGFDSLDWNVRSVRWLTIGIIAALTLIAWRDNRNDWQALEKELWRETVQYLESRATSNDAVFVHDWYCAHNSTYYSKRENMRYQALPPERFAVKPSTIERFYAPLAKDKMRLWLVLSHKTGGTEQILRRIEQDFTLVHDTIFPSRYRKYMVADTFPEKTEGLFLMKTYLSNDIRVLRFERKMEREN